MNSTPSQTSDNIPFDLFQNYWVFYQKSGGIVLRNKPKKCENPKNEDEMNFEEAKSLMAVVYLNRNNTDI